MTAAPINMIFDEITDFLASGTTAGQIIAFKPSEMLDQRLHILLDHNSHDALNDEERSELDEFLRMNHLLKMLKLKARLKQAGKARVILARLYANSLLNVPETAANIVCKVLNPHLFNSCASLNLLRKVSSAYIFVHPYLLEYFAPFDTQLFIADFPAINHVILCYSI